MKTPSTLLDLLTRAAARLEQAGINDAHREARFLAAAALNLTRADLVLRENTQATEEQTRALESFLTRRENREPLSRIVGGREFWGLWFETNEATLDPRPDSETLIEAALSHLSPRPFGERVRVRGPSASSVPTASHQDEAPLTQPSPQRGEGFSDEPLRLLDLGTGTGCLLLALLHELPAAIGLGVDKAPRALDMARKNAASLHLENRARFIEGTWEDGLACLASEEPFDIILSNPPYIPARDLEALMPEVKNHDPALALDGGEDGLTAYRQIIPATKKYLKPNGLLAFEIGQGQEHDVAALLHQEGFPQTKTRTDLGGVVRVVMGIKTSDQL